MFTGRDEVFRRPMTLRGMSLCPYLLILIKCCLTTVLVCHTACRFIRQELCLFCYCEIETEGGVSYYVPNVYEKVLNNNTDLKSLKISFPFT